MDQEKIETPLSEHERQIAGPITGGPVPEVVAKMVPEVWPLGEVRRGMTTRVQLDALNPDHRDQQIREVWRALEHPEEVEPVKGTEATWERKNILTSVVDAMTLVEQLRDPNYSLRKKEPYNDNDGVYHDGSITAEGAVDHLVNYVIKQLEVGDRRIGTPFYELDYLYGPESDFLGRGELSTDQQETLLRFIPDLSRGLRAKGEQGAKYATELEKRAATLVYEISDPQLQAVAMERALEAGSVAQKEIAEKIAKERGYDRLSKGAREEFIARYEGHCLETDALKVIIAAETDPKIQGQAIERMAVWAYQDPPKDYWVYAGSGSYKHWGSISEHEQERAEFQSGRDASRALLEYAKTEKNAKRALEVAYDMSESADRRFKHHMTATESFVSLMRDDASLSVDILKALPDFLISKRTYSERGVRTITGTETKLSRLRGQTGTERFDNQAIAIIYSEVEYDLRSAVQGENVYITDTRDRKRAEALANCLAELVTRGIVLVNYSDADRYKELERGISGAGMMRPVRTALARLAGVAKRKG